MRIAFFTDTYKPQINGVVTSIDSFCGELRKKHVVYVFSPDGPAPQDRFNYRFRSVDFKNYPGYRIAIPYRMLFEERLKRFRFDIVHIHTPAILGAAGLVTARHYKKPVVMTFHTLVPEYLHYLGVPQNKAVKRLAKKVVWKYIVWFYNQADAIITPSESIKKELEQRGIRKKIHVVPTGIRVTSAKKNKARLRKKYGFAKSDKIILHVGRVTKEKSILLIIDALESILRNGTGKNVKLIIASDGPFMGEIENEVKRKGLNNVILTGFLPEEKLKDYYALSDAFVMASKTETQAIVLIEAVQNRLPVVVLDSPVTAAFVRENGIGIVSTKKRFSKDVIRVLTNRGLRKRFAESSKRTAKKYDIAACTKKLLDVYREVAL